MTFKKLIQNYGWNQIAQNFFKLYPDQIDNSNGYRNIYLELRSKRSNKSNMIIHITKEEDKEEDNEIYFDISGKNGEIDKDIPNHEITWALELSSVSDWLGYNISDDLLKEMSEIDIICHCLYEITFFGYSNKTISRKRNNLYKLCDDIKSGKIQTYPLNFEKDFIDGNESE